MPQRDRYFVSGKCEGLFVGVNAPEGGNGAAEGGFSDLREPSGKPPVGKKRTLRGGRAFKGAGYSRAREFKRIPRTAG